MTSEKLSETEGATPPSESSPGEGEGDIVVRDRRFWARKDAEPSEKSKSRLPSVFEKMQEKIERSEDEIREIRERAREFKNETQALRHRLERDGQRKLETSKGQFLRGFLDIFDNLQRSIQVGREGSKDETGFLSLLEGIEMVVQMFHDGLKKEGIEKVPLVDQVFDPQWAEAIDVEETQDVERDNRITAVFQEAYRMGDQVLRPGKVRVARCFVKEKSNEEEKTC